MDGLDDIPIERLTPQFIQDFSIYLSADKGLRGGTVWLACQQLKGVVTNGATWIVSQRHKTKVAYQVKLLDIPLRILHHYLKPGEERVFANMEYRMMAKRILTIMQEIGITKHITMHCARHSFAVLLPCRN